MPSKENRLRYAMYLFLTTVVGVGGYQAAQMVGCESGLIDDAKTIQLPDGGTASNPNLGECVEFE